MRMVLGRLSACAVVAVAAFALLFAVPLAAGPASAAGYPPPTVPVTVPPAVCNATVTLSANGTGHASCTGCGFAPSTTATFTYGGGAFTGKVAIDAEGCFTVYITTTEPCLPNLRISVNGGPFLGASTRGTTITVRGVAPNRAVLTDTVYVNFPSNLCVVSVVHPAVTPPFAFTGADIVAMVMAGLVLVALGVLLVLFTRMRSRRQT